MSTVVFVCLGNICRSPMAEFVLKALNQGEFNVIESRATSDWEAGNPIHEGTKRVLTKHGVSYDSSKRSQQISLKDFEQFDQIIAMDEQNLEDLKTLSAGRYDAKLSLLLDHRSIPDPWFTGDFEETYRLVTLGCQ